MYKYLIVLMVGWLEILGYGAEGCGLASRQLDLSLCPAVNGYLFSSPEHEVLMVSYCDQSLSVVHLCVVNFLL